MPEFRVIRERPNDQTVHHRVYIYVRPDGDDLGWVLAGILSLRADEIEPLMEELAKTNLDAFELSRVGGDTITLPVIAGPRGPGDLTVTDVEGGARGVPQD